MPLSMSIDQLNEFMRAEFTQMADSVEVLNLSFGSIETRLKVGSESLRPGGTVSGPAMFALADVTIYLAVLAVIGPRKLAVTTNCSIDFMRKPSPGDLRAEGRILKMGRRLAVGDVLIFSSEFSEPVARASMTYSLPNSGS